MILGVQADRSKGSGVALNKPASRFQGTAAVPFMNSCSAIAAVMLVFGGAPAVLSAVGRPKPSHTTLSSLWQALSSSCTSAAQAEGHVSPLACRQGYVFTMAPLLKVTFGLNAVCEKPAT